jgi:hypothetical protein
LYLRASGAIPPDARQGFGFGLLALWHAPCVQMRLGIEEPNPLRLRS